LLTSSSFFFHTTRHHRTQLNAKATAVASSLGDTSLINAYRRRLIEAMGTIYCNGQKAFKTAVLLGMGPPYTIYYTWVANYPSTAFKVQYTSAVSQTAITEMAAGDIDYAAISTELTTAQKQLMPDAEGVPTIGYGILPVYNVRRALFNCSRLVLRRRP
jgi:ABC-type phosphate transport system substrate-binding protein